MKTNTNKVLAGLMSAAALALGAQQANAIYSNVGDYDGSRDNGRTFVIVSNSITADTTWTSNNVYVMDRLICVRAGATLTIQPGTVIRGLPVGSVPQQPGSLLASRGGKINAQGTAQAPILFTDMYDDNFGANSGTTVTIPAGVHTSDTNGLTVDYGKLNNQLTGMWGGLLMAGRSYIAWDSLDGSGTYSPDARVETTIEGILSSGEDTSYGGGNDLDNSGILNYVSVRYNGFLLGPSKEINGITFNGVGRNTQVDHLDIYQAKDDNVEFFGGCLNMKHLTTWNGCDDGLDTDTGWRGKVQFLLVVQGCATNTDLAHSQLPDSSDKGLEWDGAGDATGFNDDPQSCGTLFNFTMIGLGTNCGDVANNAFNIRDNGGARLYNGVIMDFGGGCALIEGVTNAYVAGVTNAAWPYGENCSGMKLNELYAQDRYFLSGTNKQGIVLTAGTNNYIGYPDAYAPMTAAGVAQPSKQLEFKRLVYWNMGIPHSIGMTNGFPTATGKMYVGTDNSRFSTHAHIGNYPNNTGWDIVAPGNAGGNLHFDNTALPAPSFTLLNYYERDMVNVATFTPTFRNVAHPYTNVKKLDPRANTNFWSIIATYGVQPPADGFYTPVQFVGAMGKKNWAGPWSTPWRLGGMVTNNVPTGDETGIVPTITSGAGTVNIALSVDSYAGVDADWWFVAIKTTGQIYYFNLATGTWTLGLVKTLQGPLADLTPAIPVSTASLPAGTYDVFLGVDLTKDGLVSWDSLYVAGVRITR